MRLYFYFSVFEPLLARVAQELEVRHGAEVIGGFVWGTDQRARVAAGGWRPRRLDVFSDWLRELPRAVDIDYLRDAEHRYGLPNLAMIAHADRFLSSWAHERILGVLEVALRHAEEIIRVERPDAIVFESIDSLATLVLYSVARSHGVGTVALDAGRVAGRVAVQSNTHLHRWPAVEAALRERSARGLTAEERRDAEHFIDDFRRTRPVNRYIGSGAPRLGRRDFALLATWTRRFVEDPRNITLASPVKIAGSRLSRLGRAWRSSRYLSPPRTSDRYVLFPLHFQPETTTLVCAPFAVDQPSFVADAARCIPVDHVFYVKEHRNSVGRRALRDYRRMSSHWNVRLIEPGADPFALIERASVVLSLTSTMGWEAILFDRPVVTFGEVFYNTYPLVLRADRVPQTDWPDLVERAINEWRPDRDTLLTYVSAVLAGTFKVDLLFDNPTTRPMVMHQDNVDKVVAVMAAALRIDQVRTANPAADR